MVNNILDTTCNSYVPSIQKCPKVCLMLVEQFLGFRLFIPDYKVPDLTSGVESRGDDDPAFADNVIVVEGCFLRISIEGLKV